MAFNRATIRGLVQDITGDVPDATVNRWVDLTNREIAFALTSDLQLASADIVIGSTAYDNHDVGVRAYSFNSVVLLDASDNPEHINPLEEVTISQIYDMMDRKYMTSETRRPYYWAVNGVATGLTDRISFLIYPQPTAGTYTTRKLRVTYHEMPPDLASDTQAVATQDMLRKATLEGVLRYAFLRNGDIQKYVAAEAEYQRSVTSARQTVLGRPVYGSHRRSD